MASTIYNVTDLQYHSLDNGKNEKEVKRYVI